MTPNDYFEMMRRMQASPLQDFVRQQEQLQASPLQDFVRQQDHLRYSQFDQAQLFRQAINRTVMGVDQTHSQLRELQLRPLFNIQDATAHIRVQVADFAQRLKRGVGRAIDGFAAISPVLLDALRAMAEAQESWLNASIVNTLKYYGWWYVPSMSRDLVEEICTMREEGKGRSVNARICRHYRESNGRVLRGLIKAWEDSSYFLERRVIFRSAMNAHLRGEYHLVIPSLLPHLEGIVRDFLHDLGVSDWNVHWHAVVEVLGVSQTGSKTVLVNSFSDLLTEVVFADFLPQDRYSGTSLMRHPVMHGRSLKHGSQVNSLRAFLALDTLHHYLQAVLAEHSVNDLRRIYQNAVPAAKVAAKAAKAAKKANQGSTPQVNQKPAARPTI